MLSQSELESRLQRKVEMVVADEASIGLLSTGQAIAVAFVLDRPDLLPLRMLAAFARLDQDLLEAAFNIAEAMPRKSFRNVRSPA